MNISIWENFFPPRQKLLGVFLAGLEPLIARSEEGFEMLGWFTPVLLSRSSIHLRYSRQVNPISNNSTRLLRVSPSETRIFTQLKGCFYGGPLIIIIILNTHILQYFHFEFNLFFSAHLFNPYTSDIEFTGSMSSNECIYTFVISLMCKAVNNMFVKHYCIIWWPHCRP